MPEWWGSVLVREGAPMITARFEKFGLLTEDELADIICVVPNTLTKWRGERNLPGAAYERRPVDPVSGGRG